MTPDAPIGHWFIRNPWTVQIHQHVHKFNTTVGGTFCGYCGEELKIWKK